MGKIMVMSDIHFGLDACNINCPVGIGESHQNTARIDRLFEWIEGQQVEEFVFLGDVFDLHLSNLADSIKNSRYFIEKLRHYEQLRRIIFIPGNHDHFLWLLDIYWHDIVQKMQNNDALKAFTGDLEFVQRTFSNVSGKPSLLKHVFGVNAEVVTTYPIRREDVNGRKFVFLHGHLLDRTQKMLSKIIQLGLQMDVKNLHQLESFCATQYEAIFLMAQSHEARTRLRNRYKDIQKFFKENDKRVRDFHREIEEHLDLFPPVQSGNMIKGAFP